MQFGAALSLLADTTAATSEAVDEAIGQLDAAPDVALLFASPHHREGMEAAALRLAQATSPGGTSLGCVAEGVIGGGAEAEDVPALAAWVATLPGARWDSSHLRAMSMRDGLAVSGWRAPHQPVGAVLIADPFSFPAAPFVASLGASYPGMPVVGGLAAAGPAPGHARLIHDGRLHDSGAVALTLAGEMEFCAVVSQGCRPVGEPAVVTAARDHEVREIGGRPALQFLQDLFEVLPARDQELVRQGLQLGVVVDEYRAEFGPGDFLVRPVVNAEPESGSITVAQPVEVGRTVQFQVRDPLSADEDLRMLLADQERAEGVLLFTCNGRGRRFFGAPHHDASLVTEVLHPSALAGFFAAGELGPVGGANFLHGYTATLAGLRDLQS